ncbi:Hypothetical predicted protein [Mytilus galloprovincialis]|uniref:Mab-21-like HhH/H2TH-like domain-containing protein n=1 Tax=Mytilus galloprovincialis TaxID=29158 RepID=A0A8B6FE65_MYTGA|nr:Hypothetical predicted protein [Mytilus galloprovincialis]
MDTNDQEKLVNCSKGIYQLFDTGGWGRKKEQRQSEVLFIEWASAVTGKGARFNCGGFAEGSEMGGSDRDLTVVIPNMVVLVNDSSEIKDSLVPGHTVFQMCEEGHRSCYAELRLETAETAEVNLVASQTCSLSQLLEVFPDGSKYITSKLVVEKVLKMMRNIRLRDAISVDINGPCGAYKFRAGDFGTGFEDNVYAIKGSAWPPTATEWLQRSRRFDWPSNDVIHQIADLGCLFVPLGDIYSDNQHREWRMSFVLAERLLIWNLNETQSYCYLILKLFLRMNKKITNTILDSFMMKTVLFWVAEETEKSSWKAENLIFCLEACMKKLLYFLQKKELPHYFVKNNNLLHGKMDDGDRIYAIEVKIDSMLGNLTTYVHELVGIICNGSDCIICNDISLSDMFHIDVLDGWLTRYSLHLPVYANTLHLFELAMSFFSIADIDVIQENFENIPQTILKEHVQLAFQIIYSRLGLGLYKHYLTNETVRDGNVEVDLLIEVERLLRFGLEKDAMTGKLQLVTFFIKCGRYTDAEDIIHSIFEEKVVLYEGLPLKGGLYKFAGLGDQRPQTTMAELIESPHIKIATDLYFRIDDWKYLPDALAHECLCYLGSISEQFIGHLVAVSPMVYMYFLSVLIYVHFKRSDVLNVIANLATRVESEQGTEMYQIGLNLLGYCHGLIGQYSNAIYYFQRSFKELPIIRNPCLLYTLMIIHKCSEKRVFE